MEPHAQPTAASWVASLTEKSLGVSMDTVVVVVVVVVVAVLVVVVVVVVVGVVGVVGVGVVVAQARMLVYGVTEELGNSLKYETKKENQCLTQRIILRVVIEEPGISS